MEKEKVTSQKVRSRLKELEDEKYREFHSGLLPGTENILGVRLPALRSLAKEIAKKDWEEWFFQKDDVYYEETMLRGLVTAYAKMDCDTGLSYIRAFVPDINNWAVCDCVSNTYKDAEKFPEKYWEFIAPYFLSDREYEARFGAVMLLSHFVKEEYVEEGLLRLEEIHQEGYYAKMAAAWAVSVYFAAFPERMLKYLQEECRLDEFTYRKSLQKILESYRVTKEDKAVIREMRQRG